MKRLLGHGVWRCGPLAPWHGFKFGETSRSFSSAHFFEDPYTVLGVERNATTDQIKKAYRQEALKWHPDRNPADKRAEAEKRFAAIAAAYGILSDASKRSQFDASGSPHGFAGGFPGGFSQGSGMPSNESAERLFREVFGGGVLSQLLKDLGADFGHQPSATPKAPRVGMQVQVLNDARAVKQASRSSGIDTTNDALRQRCLGRRGSVIKVDPRDRSIKVRIDSIGDVWFGLQAVHSLGSFAGAAFRRPGASAFGAGTPVQMRQQLTRKPDGTMVMRTVRTMVMPDGSTREEVHEAPVH